MKLPIPFINTKKEDSSYYLALLITDEKASAIILQEELGKIKMLGSHEGYFGSSLENMPIEQLISIVDKVISRAEEILPPDIETHKTVFGVKESWIETDTKKIKKEHLSQLKKVCDSLDLSPIGFMVISEAVSHLLHEEEGAPLSAILAQVGKKHVSLTLLRAGKTVETAEGPLEGSVTSTIDKLLKHFTVPVLPARIILFPTLEGEKLSQEFIAHQWSKSLPFLHVPQITVLPSGFDAKAVVFGAATQMGFEVLGIDKVKPVEIETKPKEPEETPLRQGSEGQAVETEEDAAENEEIEEEEPTPKKHEPPFSAEGDNFGFVMDQDVALLTPKKTSGAEETEEEDEEETSQAAFSRPPKRHHEKDEEEEVEEDAPQNPRGRYGLSKGAFAATAFWKRLNLSGISLPSLGGNKTMLKIFVPLIILVLLIAGITFAYMYQVKAKVVLTVKPNMVKTDESIIFSASSQSDYSKNIIGGKSITTSIAGTTSTNATGKKDVGEKAKGTVTVYNVSDTEKLESGTQIKSKTSNGLLFILDKDITVASGSASSPGKTDVNVTAKDIGTDYNLPSGTKFTIGNISTLEAKNDSAFSGGLKKQVTVVSKEDIAKLTSALPKSLEDKARNDIAQKAGGDDTLLQFLAVAGMEKDKFDKKVGDEAKTIKLSATINFQGMTYSNDELMKYAASRLAQKYSEASFAEKSVKVSIKNAKKKNDKEVAATASLEGGLLPKIDTDDVAKKIQGKSLKNAKTLLSDLPQVAKSDIQFSPGIPLLPHLFPSLPKNITVTIQSNE